MADNFHKTKLGQHFYQRIVPSIDKNLERIADALERIADSMDPEED